MTFKKNESIYPFKRNFALSFQFLILYARLDTVCCISLGRCYFGLETRVIIKIPKNPCYPINGNWFSLGWSKKKIFWKKNQNGWLKKTTEIFNSPNSQYFFAKISWIGPWVSRINWCKGHQCGSTYIVIKLSDVSSKSTKNVFFVFLALF